ncbi:Multidrug export protein MepA [invertebrate metagenome]|uniref:Multidrug export protein MepA n=1 Tax=invertebrate metagenome TaxID=1711999 RepID=A0A2H9T8H3_9ZZZZ
MNSEKQDHNSELSRLPVSKLFWRYTIPAVAAMLVNGLYSTIDGIFIGRAIGAEGLAAINLIWPLFGLIIGLGIMIGVGTAAHCSIAKGQENYRKARKMIGNGITLTLITGLLLSIITFTFTKTLLHWMGSSEGPLFDMAVNYLQIIGYGTLFAAAGAGFPIMVRNDERPKLATIIIVTGALLNIFLDYLLIIIIPMGVTGAAVATIIAQTVTTLWSLGYFLSHHAKLRIRLNDLGANLRYYGSILVTGLPSLTMYAYMSFVLALHNHLFLVYGSTVTLAAFSVVGYVQAIYYMMSEGIANGMQPIVSFNKGAHDYANIRKAMKLASLTVLASGITTVLFINIWPEKLALIFNTANSALISETTQGLRLHLFTMFLDGFIVVAAAYFQAMARSIIATIITVGNMLVQLPLLWILPKYLGVLGVWISLPLSNILLAIAVFYVLAKDTKKHLHQPRGRSQLS